MTEHTPRPALGIALALFAGIVVLVGIDVAADLREGATVAHVGIEAVALLLAALGVAALGWQLMVLRRVRRSLERSLDRSRQEAARWRKEAREVLAGLGAAIDREFARWKLTPAEREVALLLLKGLSHKEIASARGVSERTARQQARGVYRKAGVGGRADLAAYFLEDLLLPIQPTER